MQLTTLWVIVSGCILATFFWRLLGVVVVQRIALQGDFYEWRTKSALAYFAYNCFINRIVYYKNDSKGIPWKFFEDNFLCNGKEVKDLKKSNRNSPSKNDKDLIDSLF